MATMEATPTHIHIAPESKSNRRGINERKYVHTEYWTVGTATAARWEWQQKTQPLWPECNYGLRRLLLFCSHIGINIPVSRLHSTCKSLISLLKINCGERLLKEYRQRRITKIIIHLWNALKILDMWCECHRVNRCDTFFHSVCEFHVYFLHQRAY